MEYAITNPDGLFWSKDEGWVKYGFDIFNDKERIDFPPIHNSKWVTHADVRIPDNIMKGAAEYIEQFTGILFTDDEIQMLAREGEITLDIIRGGEIATGEREMLQDVMATRFTGRGWPSYGDPDIPNLASDLLTGIQIWRESGHVFPVRRVLNAVQQQAASEAIAEHLGEIQKLARIAVNAWKASGKFNKTLSLIEVHIEQTRRLLHDLTGEPPLR